MNKEIKKQFYKIYNDKKQNIVRDQKILDFIHKKLQQERERIIEVILKVEKTYLSCPPPDEELRSEAMGSIKVCDIIIKNIK